MEGNTANILRRINDQVAKELGSPMEEYDDKDNHLQAIEILKEHVPVSKCRACNFGEDFNGVDFDEEDETTYCGKCISDEGYEQTALAVGNGTLIESGIRLNKKKGDKFEKRIKKLIKKAIKEGILAKPEPHENRGDASGGTE
jgi:hypothetical protein